MIKITKYFFLIIFLVLVQNCKLYKNPEDTQELSKSAVPVDLELTEYWKQGVSDTIPIADNWHTTFNDDLLNELVLESIDTTNLNIIYQLAGIDAAIARVQLAKSGGKIQLDYSGGYNGLFSTNGSSLNSFKASAPLSWEIDLWGKIEAGVLAADENLLSEIQNYAFTRQSIAGLVSNLYFEIGGINQRISIGTEFLKLNESISEILQRKESVGIINYQDIHLTESQIYSIKNTIEDSKNNLQKKVRDLETLLGRYPDNSLKILWTPEHIEQILEISNPIELINRRPDVKSNENKVRALFYLKEQALLAKYPSLVLSASVSLSSINDLLFGGGASLFGPIFNGGALDGRIDEATAQQKQALANYGLSILNAFKEVETSLNAQVLLANQENFMQLSVEESKKAYEISLSQYDVGKIDLLSLLQIQSKWLLEEILLVDVKEKNYHERVQLHLALGGNITL